MIPSGETPIPQEVEEEYYASIPTIYERLRPPLSRGMKLFLGVPQEHLPKLEELLRSRHKLLHPDAPFVVVDVAEIIQRKSIEPVDFNRDLIYEEALKQLAPETAGKTRYDPLQEFKDRASEFRQKIKEQDVEARDQRVGLFIKNLDAATVQMTPAQVRTLILSTFRIGWEFNIYGHVSSQKRIDLSGGAGEALNDARIIWEE